MEVILQLPTGIHLSPGATSSTQRIQAPACQFSQKPPSRDKHGGMFGGHAPLVSTKHFLFTFWEIVMMSGVGSWEPHPTITDMTAGRLNDG